MGPTHRYMSTLGGLLIVVACLATSRSPAQLTQPKLAPGVLRVIPGEPEEQDTVTGPMELTELAEVAQPWKPHFGPETDTLHSLALDITIRRPVWQLEIATKTLRMVTVNTGGQKLRVWYLLYRLKNTGGNLRPVPQNGGRSFGLEKYDRTIRFFPHFELVDQEHNLRYLDRVVPAAVTRIQQIELRDPKIPLYDSVSIARLPIQPSSDSIDRSVWGVAMWTGVDRRADFISVYVQGLTNAYRFTDAPGQDRRYFYKTLQLNFWRPGDAVHETSSEFRRGLPTFQEGDQLDKALKMYGMSERSDHAWVFRP